MKRKILIAVSALLIAGLAVTGVVLMNRNKPETVLSNTYSAKELDSVELNKKLSGAVDKSDLAKVKTAVLENEIPEENQERLATLIEEYGAENALIGYSYLNRRTGTWDELTQILDSSSDKSWAEVFEEYAESQPEYYEQTFSLDKLKEWIDNRGYSPADIKSLERISQGVLFHGEDLTVK